MKLFLGAIAITCMVFLSSSFVSAANPFGLSQKCASRGGDSCLKLQKELEQCKKIPGCLAALNPLPDSVLSDISSDQGAPAGVRNRAQEILAQRRQERADREKRHANFANLRVGMSLAEVEATIGPIDPHLRSIVAAIISFDVKPATQEAAATATANLRLAYSGWDHLPNPAVGVLREVHIIVTDTGWSEDVSGENPTASTYAFMNSEYVLLFDCQGKLKRFQRGMNWSVAALAH